MLNEHDLKDWEKGEVTELYKVPNNTYVQDVDTGWIVKFFHCDGMYSYCHDLNGKTVHLKAWAKVYPLKEKNETV